MSLCLAEQSLGNRARILLGMAMLLILMGKTLHLWNMKEVQDNYTYCYVFYFSLWDLSSPSRIELVSTGLQRHPYYCMCEKENSYLFSKHKSCFCSMTFASVSVCFCIDLTPKFLLVQETVKTVSQAHTQPSHLNEVFTICQVTGVLGFFFFQQSHSSIQRLP